MKYELNTRRRLFNFQLPDWFTAHKLSILLFAFYMSYWYNFNAKFTALPDEYNISEPYHMSPLVSFIWHYSFCRYLFNIM